MKLKSLFILPAVFLIFISWKYLPINGSEPFEKGNIKVSILYPVEQGKTFDSTYYSEKHMPMVAGLFGDKLLSYGIEKGVSGRLPEEEPAFIAIGYFYFNQVADYYEVFGPNAEQILSDIPNYTNIQPTILISEIVH